MPHILKKNEKVHFKEYWFQNVSRLKWAMMILEHAWEVLA